MLACVLSFGPWICVYGVNAKRNRFNSSEYAKFNAKCSICEMDSDHQMLSITFNTTKINILQAFIFYLFNFIQWPRFWRWHWLRLVFSVFKSRIYLLNSNVLQFIERFPLFDCFFRLFSFCSVCVCRSCVCELVAIVRFIGEFIALQKCAAIFYSNIDCFDQYLCGFLCRLSFPKINPAFLWIQIKVRENHKDWRSTSKLLSEWRAVNSATWQRNETAQNT